MFQQNLLEGGCARQTHPSGRREHHQYSQTAVPGVETLGQHVNVSRVQPDEGRLSGRCFPGPKPEIKEDSKDHQNSDSDDGKSASPGLIQLHFIDTVRVEGSAALQLRKKNPRRPLLVVVALCSLRLYRIH